MKKVACFEWRESVKFSTTNGSMIRDNECMGSVGAGFSRKYEKCGEEDDSVYFDNLASSASIGHLFHDEVPLDSCLVGHSVQAYSCGVAAFGNPSNITRLVYRDIVSIDSKLGISLKFIKSGKDLSAFVKDSYISIMERAAMCEECYSEALDDPNECSDSFAIQMLAVSEAPTWLFSENVLLYDTSLLELSGPAPLDSKTFITNTIFSNFRQTENCTNNAVFTSPQSAL